MCALKPNEESNVTPTFFYIGIGSWAKRGNSLIEFRIQMILSYGKLLVFKTKRASH